MKNNKVKKMMCDVIGNCTWVVSNKGNGVFSCSLFATKKDNGYKYLNGALSIGVVSIAGNQHQLQSVAKGWKARCNR